MKRVNFEIGFAVLAGCLRGVLSLGCAWLLKAVVDIVTGETDMNFSYFCAVAIAYYLTYLLVFRLSKGLYIHASGSMRIKMKERLFTGLLWAPDKVHQRRKSGDVLSKFQYQVDLLETSFYEPLFSLITNVVVLAASMGAVLILQWYIAPGIAIIFAIYLAMVKGINKKIETFQGESVRLKTEEENTLVTMVKGFYTARDYGQEGYFLSRYTACAKAFAGASCKCNFYYDVLSLISANLETAVTLLLILIGGIMLESGNLSVTAGGILGIIQLVSGMIGPVGSLGPSISEIKSVKKVRQDLAAFEETGLAGKEEWTARQEPLPRLRMLSLRHVSFFYEGNQVPVLNDVSMEMKAGGKYAIIGESGSGKSTLLKLILKQLEPDAGSVCWNETPYDRIGKAELLPRIGYAAQEPMMFHKNIFDNIIVSGGFSQEADELKLKKVLAESGMETMRNGMPAAEILAVPAQELSGGEKKRVAYARALYKDCEILVADEVTSSLHEDMALALEKDLLKAEGVLVIHVTHELSDRMKPLYDGIFVVAGGKVTLSSCAQ